MDIKRYMILGIGICMALLVGCSDEIAHEDAVNDNTLRLLSVNLSDNRAEEVTITKAEVITSGITEVGLVVTKVSDNTYYDTAHPALTFSKSGTSWSSGNSSILLKAETGDANAYGFYPAAATTTNDNNVPKMDVTVRSINTFKITATDSQTDYLYGYKKDITSSNPAISLTLEHALAKISFRIDKPQNTTENVKLAKLEIQSPLNRLQVGSGTVNLSTGSLDLPSSSSVSLTNTGNELGATVDVNDLLELSANESSPNLSCLIAPTSGTESSLSFKLTVQINDGTLRELETGTTSATWERGKHYLYHITVDKQKATLTGVKIESWKSDSSQSVNIDISN